jgi:microcystin-dependent protein
MDPFLGQIMMVGFNFAPKGWAFCNGQLLPIQQYTALFSLLGTIYGGDGQTTFALPNMQSRVPIHFGEGAGLSSYVMGQQSGFENITLSTSQIPSHSHALNATNAAGDQSLPGGHILAAESTGITAYSTGAITTAMNVNSISASGSNQPHPNIQPYLVVNFIIALEGIYPSRS